MRVKNNCRKAAALIIIVCMAALFPACHKQAKKETSAVQAVSTTTVPVQTTAGTATTKPADSTQTLKRYDSLDEVQKEVYDLLEDAISQQKTVIALTPEDYRQQRFDNVFYYAYLVDHPDCFHVRGNSQVLENTANGNRYYRFCLTYVYDEKEYRNRMKKIEEVFDSIQTALPPDAGEEEKARAVYDYLIDHCRYDDTYSGNSLEETKTTASYADGALIDGKAVCSGYSRAFKLLMDQFSIACTCICNDEHEWNLIRFGGNCYHIDVTWADDGSDERYKYFCVSDDSIYRNHKKAIGKLPSCNWDL